ncbi:class I SAM-dependent methyltransferase [Rubinisphaera margarita]|uniref:class I SAM-dependent methyltransferase n=1 Tax=Rubinisphaera margarita TaxID=2909586 RepID=UPI001EE98A1C|nr:class I SAM-dependent methyltransferase [Rubinisphaera margarita]MCG6154845.1 class I SAM-dependent methyltransferase [Rubinisphaera margarita]
MNCSVPLDPQLNSHPTGERMFRPDAQTSTIDRMLFARQQAAYHLVEPLIPDRGAVLDIACGTGYGTETLASFGAQVAGVDIDPRTIDLCRETIKRPECQFLVGSGTEIPCSDESFDTVVSFQTIEHIKDHEGFVRELRRVLLPGGTCVITTPNRLLRLQPGQRPWNRFHVREYDAVQLEELLRRVFSSVDIQGVSAPPAIMKLEHARLSSARRIAKYDPWGFRHRLAPSLKKTLAGMLKSIPQPPGNRDSAGSGQPFPWNDFYLTDDVADSLDLFAVCR